MQLAALNQLPSLQRKAALTTCCGASAWVEKMNALFPFPDKKILFEKAIEVWFDLSQKDWQEAFAQHPKIGDIQSLKEKFAATATWAAGEQSAVQEALEEILHELAKENKAYEEKFGYIFIVCATGKSAAEMLQLLKSRLSNHADREIILAAAEQARITQIRLEKLLS